jgi:hypothetical protein
MRRGRTLPSKNRRRNTRGVVLQRLYGDGFDMNGAAGYKRAAPAVHTF